MRALLVLVIAACSSSAPRSAPPPPPPPPPVDAGAPIAILDAGAAPRGCPASFQLASGSCSGGAGCTYPEGACRCETPRWCGGAAPPSDFRSMPGRWRCQAAVLAPGACPMDQPPPGSACTTDGQVCDYTCSCVATSTCTNGRWLAEHGPCKPSAPPRS